MLYEAKARRSIRSGKWLYILSRDGATIWFSDASYHTREAALRAARRKSIESASRIALRGLSHPVYKETT